MTIKDTLQETYTALSANKVRSGLTVLGIVIGIGSVIAMVSVGQGAASGIQSSIQSLGSNLLQVSPGAQRIAGGFGVSLGRGSASTLTQADADAIGAQVADINAVATEVSGRQQVTAKGTNTNTSVVGVTSAYPQIRNLQMDQGDFISDTQNQNISKVAVLGPTAASDLFGTDDSTADGLPDGIVGQTIRIKGMEFTVIGITAAKGGSGFSNQDDTIYIPAASAQRYLTGNSGVTTIDIQASSNGAMAQVQDDVTNLLLERHNISDPTKADFSVLNQNDLLSTVSSVSATLTLLLASIAGISLVVGGIGIMNMMLTTVTERTREIGLRKAIGAKKADISRQFLVEAVALTVAGGVIGIVLGVGIAVGANMLGLLTTSVSWSSVVLAFGVSAAIGIAFGYYPARRAASLNPIEALRYE
ncbi:MAG TPA: ABC transporter permease [Candidatus Paceibacterota bacterium]|nr:ABC transporter permease [Candidatus Paceibacterota bacterium]